MDPHKISEPTEISLLRQELDPFELYWYTTLGSTNTEAARLMKNESTKPPFVVFTERQTEGRGRGNNTWESPRGVLTVTFVIPHKPLLLPHCVPLLAGLAVRDALSNLGATSVGLKWPNDVWADGLKVAGLLCERVEGGDMIGVGVNVCNQPRDLPSSIAKRSTTVSLLAGREVSTYDTIRALTKQVAAYFIDSRYTIEQAIEWYSDSLVIKGRKIRVSDCGLKKSLNSIEGYCHGIDDCGRLVIINNDGRHVIISGRVTVIDPIDNQQ